MNIVNKLTVRHLKQNRGRTLITIMGIMLSVAMVCAVAGFVMSMRDMMHHTVIESRGDYHIAYFGVTPQTAEEIAAEDVFSSHYTKEEENPELVTLYVRFENPGRDYLDIASEISAKYEIQGLSANTELLALEGVIAQDSVMMMFIWIAVIAITIIVAGSVIVIANAFYISSSERVRQFGLLKSVGATKSQIGKSILFEAFALAIIAIPLGIALGFLIQAAVLRLTNNLLVDLNELNNNTINFKVAFDPVIIYISAAIAAVTMLISAWLPARRAAKISPIDAIRQTKDIRIRGRQLKTSRLTQKLFGFEGTLAAKSLKRSRGKYRATVISLTVSVVLFVSVSSLVWAMNKGTELEYGGYDFDVLIGARDDLEKQDWVNEQLATILGSEISPYQSLSGAFTIPPEGFLTEDAKNYYRVRHQAEIPSEIYVKLIAYPDSEFQKITSAAQGETAGILINTSGKVSADGKHVEYMPYNYKPGTTFMLKTPDETIGITLAAEIREIPAVVPAALYDIETVNVLVPESVFRTLAMNKENNLNALSFFSVTTADPDEYCAAAEELLAGEDDLSIMNVSQITRLNRNIVLIIMLFGYGFIAMLSLIAVTSVVATISTGMALRKQEFAMLYSAGMTPGGMNKMLNLESLLYGVKSLAIGLPIGVGLSLLIHRSLSRTIVFDYELPLTAMLISAVAVMLLTFGTMRYGKNKLNKVSIVEAIRNETA